MAIDESMEDHIKDTERTSYWQGVTFQGTYEHKLETWAAYKVHMPNTCDEGNIWDEAVGLLSESVAAKRRRWGVHNIFIAGDWNLGIRKQLDNSDERMARGGGGLGGPGSGDQGPRRPQPKAKPCLADGRATPSTAPTAHTAKLLRNSKPAARDLSRHPRPRFGTTGPLA